MIQHESGEGRVQTASAIEQAPALEDAGHDLVDPVSIAAIHRC